ncbi:MAG: hypothetical protein P4L61_00635 [Candidatus Pacebacteria bacterium]|nr:hypothetical protein [Candidatus Paceibacterota bacterium]
MKQNNNAGKEQAKTVQIVSIEVRTASHGVTLWLLPALGVLKSQISRQVERGELWKK